VNLSQTTKYKLAAAQALRDAMEHEGDGDRDLLMGRVDWRSFCEITGCSKPYFYKIGEQLRGTRYVNKEGRRLTIDVFGLIDFLEGDETVWSQMFKDADYPETELTLSHIKDLERAVVKARNAIKHLLSVVRERPAAVGVGRFPVYDGGDIERLLETLIELEVVSPQARWEKKAS
jgi:hypothetical protein